MKHEAKLYQNSVLWSDNSEYLAVFSNSNIGSKILKILRMVDEKEFVI